MKITLHNKTSVWRLRLVEWRCAYAPGGKISGFHGESPGIVVVGGENPHGNLGCK